VATGAAASAAVAIVLANLIRGREVPGVTVLLFAGIPIPVAGQLWGIATLLGRRNRAEGGRPQVALAE
jgi:cobalamin biosynthesis protein CbiD